MMIDQLRFRKLDFAGLQKLVSWAQEEGWNPGLHDAEIFWQTDPDGFYGYVHEGELIGGGSIVSYDGAFGFMGFFIIRPEYRSNGIGRKLWYERRDTLLSRLKPGAPIGMDGVVAMQQFYKKGGFEIAFRDERYGRIGKAFQVHPKISPITETDLPGIFQYDVRCFGFPRYHFLKSWLFQPGGHGFKFIESGNLRGFALVRKAAVGFKVGPLFADDSFVARELYKACLNAAQGASLYIDVPMLNSDAVAMMREFDAECVFECARMYYGNAPDLPVRKIFGITTLELG